MHSDTRRFRAAAFTAAAVLLLAACGNNAESALSPGDRSRPIEAEPRIADGRAELGRPDQVVPDIRQQLDAARVGGQSHGDEVLELVEPLDQAPIPEQAVALRDRQSRNEAGEPNRLDEAAALACSDVERALTALDDGDRPKATDLLVSAVDRTARSSVDDIAAWSTTLAELVDDDTGAGGAPAPLPGFLSACTRGGYEL